MIIRKKPLNKMVQTNDQDMVDNSISASMPKLSNASKLFTPHSVYSHPTLHSTTSKNIERRTIVPCHLPMWLKATLC